MITDYNCSYCGLAYGTSPDSHWCAAGQAARNKHYNEALRLQKVIDKFPLPELVPIKADLDIEDIRADMPICPYCGKVDNLWWDGMEDPLDDGEEREMVCKRCEKDYEVEVSISYTFKTKKIS